MKPAESKLIKYYEVTVFKSGIIEIVFNCVARYADVYRNANDVFTITVRYGKEEQDEIVVIPELSKIGTGDYYTLYSAEKEQAVIHCVPLSYYDEDGMKTLNFNKGADPTIL